MLVGKRGGLVAAVLVAAVGTLGIAATALASGGVRRGGGSAGIRVHGGWTIVVRRHGRTVARRRFENRYVGQELNQLLAGKARMGYMRILLGHLNASADTIDGPCHIDALPQFRISAGPTGCVIAAGDDPIQGTNVSKTLTLSTGYAASSLDALTLKGSATAQESGSIDIVQTRDYECYLVSQKFDCGRGGSDNYFANAFTQKKLAKPIPVQKGEQIEAKVVISFS